MKQSFFACPAPFSFPIVVIQYRKGADGMSFEDLEIDAHYSPRERQMRIYRYLFENSNKDHYVSTKQLKAFLYNLGIEVHINTLYNDLVEIQTTFGVSIEYDQRKKGYRMTGTLFEPYEIRLIAHSIQSSKFITQTKARDLIGKIKTLTDTYTASSLASDAFVFDRIRSQNDSSIPHIERLYQAITEDSQIKFKRYSFTPDKSNPKSYSKSGQLLTVSPYKLIWHNGNLYLLAYVGGKRNRLDYFRVDRMENITKPLGIQREGKEKYQEYEKKQKKVKVFDMVMGTQYDVKMRFVNGLASAVIDKFGKDIMMIPDGDHFITTQTIDVNAAFLAWMASFGGGAEIVGPDKVIERMKKFIENAAKVYKNDGETL